MDLGKLRKPDLVMLCEEMGIEVATLRRKPLLIQAIEDSGADEEELSECWELIQERMKRESEDKERETVRRKEEAEIQIREIERLRLQLQIVEAKCASSYRPLPVPRHASSLLRGLAKVSSHEQWIPVSKHPLVRRFVPPSTKGPMGSGERDLQLWMVP
ncbi:hypothetical protein HPB50_003422 [Hyalomma asiaticum]|uniref:Uncharacterized protein n=1 Tax=Hyalomma asiaticum TaxID=266040 RepID=A0ACB7SMB5_HYAAI|nr:hypothetical protein HPB50_003422 [Hyalomma asiaticum]